LAFRTQARSPSGKLRAYGTLVLDMRLKKLEEFRGMSLRLKKATGIPASARNAVEIVKQMKLMIRELERKRDVKKLRAIQNGDLSLASAFVLWQEGRLDLAEEHGDKKVLKHWRAYINTANRREITRRNRLVIVAALENHGFISAKNVLNDLPSLLKRIRLHYKNAKQLVMFNTIRIELLSFLKEGLELDEESGVVRAVKKVPRFKKLVRRKHHPFLSPSDCADFCREVKNGKSVHKNHYANVILFACLHGVRPTELNKIEIDPTTEHLKVVGTKNENADRVVPLLLSPDQLPTNPPKIDTLNRLFERMGSQVRVRDFRRTYSRWVEEAGISHLHYKVYLGHGSRTVTDLYQRADPDQSALDEDAKKLQVWFDKELKRTPTERQKPQPVSALGVHMAFSNRVDIKKLLDDWMVADRQANPGLQEMDAAGEDED
jgi:hypothetical protein